MKKMSSMGLPHFGITVNKKGEEQKVPRLYFCKKQIFYQVKGKKIYDFHFVLFFCLLSPFSPSRRTLVRLRDEERQFLLKIRLPPILFSLNHQTANEHRQLGGIFYCESCDKACLSVENFCVLANLIPIGSV